MSPDSAAGSESRGTFIVFWCLISSFLPLNRSEIAAYFEWKIRTKLLPSKAGIDEIKRFSIALQKQLCFRRACHNLRTRAFYEMAESFMAHEKRFNATSMLPGRDNDFAMTALPVPVLCEDFVTAANFIVRKWAFSCIDPFSWNLLFSLPRTVHCCHHYGEHKGALFLS